MLTEIVIRTKNLSDENVCMFMEIYIQKGFSVDVKWDSKSGIYEVKLTK